MIPLNTEFLIKNGKREFAVLPYEEYEQLLSLLEDLEDLHELRIAKRAESDAPCSEARGQKLRNSCIIFGLNISNGIPMGRSQTTSQSKKTSN
jgi:hypothetical protein